MKLELMWEGIECFHFNYICVQTYLNKFEGWHPQTEQSYILDTRKRSVRCYYNEQEMQEVSKSSIANFLSQEWVEHFITHSEDVLRVAEAFTQETHLKNKDVSKEVLIDRTKRASKIMYDTLLAFHVTQPQYTWGLEPYIFSLLPDLSKEKKRESIALLAQSSQPSLLTEEEDAWGTLITNLKKEYASLPEDTAVQAVLEEHASSYGLVHAADGQEPWDYVSLFARLRDDWERTDLIHDRIKESEKLEREKQSLVDEYGISDEVLRICTTLARMSHIRLETRLRGWMPVESIFANQLLPILAHFVPFTSEQLESCTPKELFEILEGMGRLDVKDLDGRHEHCVVGMIKGEEVLWVGDEATAKLAPLLPTIDYATQEIIGQPVMKGRAEGPCHIISWDIDLSADQIDEMPQGAVLVAGQTRPQLMAVIKKASAIITDEGGLLSHAAIVARELRIPCVIGTKYATKILKQGDIVEVDADNGIVTILERKSK